MFTPLADDAERMVSEDRVRLHSHAAAVHSSMVFGFNLFLPFRVGGADALGALLTTLVGLALRVERIQFEYGPTEILAESRKDPPDDDDIWTSSDVGIQVRDPSGRRGIVLMEVKLSEGGFTPCGGRESPGNRRQDVCDSAGNFFADPNACYLTRPARARRDRRYWSIFTEAHGSVGAAPWRTRRSHGPVGGPDEERREHPARARSSCAARLILGSEWDLKTFYAPVRRLLREVHVSPPTAGELVSILHFAWCAAASPLERRAIAIAGAAIELASSDVEKDQGARLDRAHWALLGETGNDEHIRQSLIDTVTNMRHSSEFSDETVDYCAGLIADWFADHYCRDERLPLDLVRDVLRAPRNVGGRGKRKKPDPWHALFKAFVRPMCAAFSRTRLPEGAGGQALRMCEGS